MTEEEFRGRSSVDAKAEAPEPLMQFFEAWPNVATFEQGAAIKIMGNSFHKIASDIIATLPRNPERTVALRKLLEARDCAMRSAVMK